MSTTTGDSSFTKQLGGAADEARRAEQLNTHRELDGLYAQVEQAFRWQLALSRRQDAMIRSIVALEMYDERAPLRGRERVGIISGLEAMVSARDHAAGTTP